MLDLCLKVPLGATAPIKYAPMEVDAVNRVADGRAQRKQVTSDCSKPFFDGRKSERGRRKTTT